MIHLPIINFVVQGGNKVELDYADCAIIDITLLEARNVVEYNFLYEGSSKRYSSITKELNMYIQGGFYDD